MKRSIPTLALLAAPAFVAFMVLTMSGCGSLGLSPTAWTGPPEQGEPELAALGEPAENEESFQ